MIPSKSLTNQEIVTTYKKTRNHSELSPEFEPENSKKPKYSMEKVQKTLDVLVQKFAEMTAAIKSIDSRMSKIEKDLSDMKTQNDASEKKIEELSQTQCHIQNVVKKHNGILNTMSQSQLDNQLMISGMSPAINEEQLKNDLDKWSNGICKSNSIRRIAFSAIPNKPKVAFVHFYNVGDKQRLFDYVRMKQRDINKKFIPILNEQVFTLAADDIFKPNQLKFNDPLTELNRKIFNAARKLKKDNKIERFYLSNGKMYIKINTQQKPTVVESEEDLEAFVSSLPMDMA